MQENVNALVHRIDGARMRELLVDFANVQSVNDRALAAAEWYAGLLRASGAVEASVRREGLVAPAVVAGFPGSTRAPALQFVGYLASPGAVRRRAFSVDGHVYGRAVGSSAAGLIAAAEAARILATDSPLPGGGLLFLARPMGDPSEESADYARLIAQGVVGKAVVITSGPSRMVPVAGMGSCMFQVVFSAPSELGMASGPQVTVIDAAHLLCGALRRRHRALHGECDSLAGPEAIVVGRIGGGERFDLMPGSSWVQGVWRYGPSRGERSVRAEIERVARRAAAACGATALVTMRVGRQPFWLDQTLPLVRALQAGYHDAWGSDLPVGGCCVPCDIPIFLAHGVPAVCHGPRLAPVRAEGGEECVATEDLIRLAEVYLRLSVSILRETARDHESGSSEARAAVEPSRLSQTSLVGQGRCP
jgi:acetylornithine deacetylase/succinyl-diaminopimelate desuccinylase-like protein